VRPRHGRLDLDCRARDRLPAVEVGQADDERPVEPLAGGAGGDARLGLAVAVRRSGPRRDRAQSEGQQKDGETRDLVLL
jgi:hypothetical protein